MGGRLLLEKVVRVGKHMARDRETPFDGGPDTQGKRLLLLEGETGNVEALVWGEGRGRSPTMLGQL